MRPAFAGSGSPIQSVISAGTICHETPNLSVSQPHGYSNKSGGSCLTYVGTEEPNAIVLGPATSRQTTQQASAFTHTHEAHVSPNSKAIAATLYCCYEWTCEMLMPFGSDLIDFFVLGFRSSQVADVKVYTFRSRYHLNQLYRLGKLESPIIKHSCAGC